MLSILPGKEATDREMFDRYSGPDREKFADWHRRNGFTRHSVWHQKLPDGTTLAIVLLEADDVQAFAAAGTSPDEFAREFRRSVGDVHGVDLATAPPPDVVPIFDWRAQ